MATLSDYSENLAVDLITNYGVASRYIALFTTVPHFETGLAGVEASGGGYDRGDIDFTAASGGAATNTGSFTWEVGANIATGTYYGWGVYTDITGGDFLFGDEFSTPRILTGTGDTLTFDAGSITVTIT